MEKLQREYPRLPVVAVGIVLLREGKILLAKRRNPPGAGLWSIPGGVVEEGEKLEEAVIREAKEELGIDVRPAYPIWVSEVVDRDELGRIRYHYVIIDYLCDVLSGTPSAGSDVSEVGWFDLNSELAEVTRSTRDLIKALRRRVINVRNSDVEELIICTPEGHIHKRIFLVLKDAIIVLQEATAESIARAVVEVEMHPTRRCIRLKGMNIERPFRKRGYNEYQLIETDEKDEDIRKRVKELIGDEKDS
ncbi:MAG: NUDIX hydrolase [Candidatus Methanodesulfokora sp.]|jgi:ADP-ribose pyrophosphatase YjhB (NUDIX family)